MSGQWDDEALTNLLSELKELGTDISLSGFYDVDLKQMLGDIEVPLFEEGTEADQGDLGVLSSS